MPHDIPPGGYQCAGHYDPGKRCTRTIWKGTLCTPCRDNGVEPKATSQGREGT